MDVPITPVSAVQLTWAISAKFSQNEQTRDHGKSVEREYESMLEGFRKLVDNTASSTEKQRHRKYYVSLVSSVDAALKNFQTYLKYRDDRTKELKDLLDEQIASINRTKTFGLSFENAVPKLASSAAIGGISGLTVTGLLQQFNLNQLQQNVVLLAFLGIGYLVTEFVILPLTIRSTKKAMNKTNGKSKELYDLYIERCRDELTDLFETLRETYKDAYGEDFDVPKVEGDKWNIDNVLPVNVRYPVEY